MKKVFLLILPAIIASLALFCTYPLSITSPGLFLTEEPLTEETLFLSKIIENEKEETALVTGSLDTVAFEYWDGEFQKDSNENYALPPQPEIEPDSFAIVGIGDSLTAGTGSEFNKGYLDPVRKYYETNSEEDVVLVNHSVYGSETVHLLRRLDDPGISSDIEQADVLFMTIGGNDIVSIFNKNFTHLSIEDFKEGEKEYTAKLRKVMSTIRLLNPDVPVYFVGIFNPVYEALSEVKEFNDIITGWNRSAEDVLAMYPNANFIPIQQLFEKDTELYLAEDKFHPNEDGYKRIGEEIISRTEEIVTAHR
ncbi:GDSL-type esterase/lipase family protein [Bacillus sp. AK031]